MRPTGVTSHSQGDPGTPGLGPSLPQLCHLGRMPWITDSFSPTFGDFLTLGKALNFPLKHVSSLPLNVLSEH